MAVLLHQSQYSDYTSKIYEESKSLLKEYLYLKIKVCCVICNGEFDQESQFESHIREHHLLDINVEDSINFTAQDNAICGDRLNDTEDSNENIGVEGDDTEEVCVIETKTTNLAATSNICHAGHSVVMESLHLHGHNYALPINPLYEISKCFQCDKYLEKCGKQKRVLPEEIEVVYQDGNKRFRCKVCEKLLITREACEGHINLHTGKRPYLCDICGKGCTSKMLLTTHMSAQHDDRVLPCEICGKNFKGKVNLDRHVTTVHEKNHRCEICKKLFSKCGLRNHMPVHTNEMKYSCKKCGKKFRFNNNMMAHQKKCY